MKNFAATATHRATLMISITLMAVGTIKATPTAIRMGTHTSIASPTKDRACWKVWRWQWAGRGSIMRRRESRTLMLKALIYRYCSAAYALRLARCVILALPWHSVKDATTTWPSSAHLTLID